MYSHGQQERKLCEVQVFLEHVACNWCAAGIELLPLGEGSSLVPVPPGDVPTEIANEKIEAAWTQEGDMVIPMCISL